MNGAVRTCAGIDEVSRTGRRWRTRKVRRDCQSARVAPGVPAQPQAISRQQPAGPQSQPPAQPRPVEPVSPPPSGLPHFGFSENVDSRLTPEAHADLARQAGADSQRLTIGWNWAEPYKDDYRLGGFDQIYRASVARGVRPLITIMFSPWWTWSPGTQCDRFGPQCTFPPDPAFDSEWREFVALVAQRYPQAIGIEIWNEPNLRVFWKPSPDPARYTDLLQQAYRAVKSVDPGMPVISGGLANASTTQDGTESLVDFLTGIYDNGGKGYMDGIGFHPYGAIPTRTDFVERSADRVRAVRDRNGDGNKPLWATEFGLTTTGNPWPNVWTEQEQAAGLALHYKTLAAMPDVAGIYLHTLLEPEGSRAGEGPGFGVVRGDGTPKPAFCAVAAARGAGPGCGS